MTTKESLNLDGICQMESFSKVSRFKLVGYSLTKHIANGIHLKLGTFDIAGHSWAIGFFPNGPNRVDSLPYTADYASYIAIHGTLLTETTTVMFVDFEFSLLDHNGKPSPSKNFIRTINKTGNDFVIPQFMKISDFVLSEYLKDDCFILQVSGRVVKPSHIDAAKKQIVVPSSNLYQHLNKLLESKEGTDITFEVNEERFLAHKIVLAARSPVFKAQFFGSMIERESNLVKIEDVNPEVFKLMLHFVYTDTLPQNDAMEISSEMAQHLLVVADQYGLERLKLICGEILCNKLTVESAATTLVLAEQHNCEPLKDFCVDFVASREVLNGE